ncbi:bromodomain-containing protein 8 [Scaptodrosophila lebanonensis]|uniref:Bromodomain-containing protein 8 n=1 Tax=Drosophila lebanonensis TaxID=7225 RepID=A0A6J2SZ35_DROLE|nr:bromodomain-containing protein 8 [Scaptodrosophila lebanonensis]
MSALAQDRLQMSRMPLDQWSKREQLCLASAVSCSGDQNWITVSRTLKTVCGNGATPDWYSQKNCAVQYGHLLESVETTKRKKRSSESGVSSPAIEPPTELLLRRLTEERMAEIKAQMRRDQEEYCKVFREIEALQSDDITEQELQEMWQQVENQQETQRIDEMKLENRMREREQRKKEMAISWRNTAARRNNSATDTTSVDMDVEEIAASSSSTSSTTSNKSALPSPLLTSLLKSPTAAPTAVSPVHSPAVGAGSVARATAPTITTLLTSGTSAISNQPAITLKNASDSAFITRPISGPPTVEAHTPTTPGTPGPSPSQAAPTLSMLLEKNKAMKSSETSSTAQQPAQPTDTEVSSQQQPAMNAKSSSESAIPNSTNSQSDETDPNEEQQLLQVFENIDDIIDDIDIDMSSVIDEDILKDVADEAEQTASPNDKPEVVDFEDKLDSLKRGQTAASSPAPGADGTSDSNETGVTKPTEVVIGSSDDSNDNIPLATVASQESKESQMQSQNDDETSQIVSTIEPVEEANENVAMEMTARIEQEKAASIAEKESEQPPEVAIATEKTEAEKPQQGHSESTPTPIEDTIEGAIIEETTTEEGIKEELKIDDKVKPDAATMEPKATITISVHDTDEEYSSLTDSSKQDEPTRNAKQPKMPSRESVTVEPKTEAEPSGSGSGAHVIPQPPGALARPPLLRKLPHRDRSESPMIDDDMATASDHSTAKTTNARRRCSSTPLIDSIPNSPASSEHTDDRRETRAATKKLFLTIYSTLNESKHAAPFRRAFHDEHAHKYSELCLRPMDLPTIKRNIDSGAIRSLSELHRDILLMCQNLLTIYKPQMSHYKTARLFLQDCQAIKELAAHPETSGMKMDREKHGVHKARSGSRKSQRHH